MADRSRKSSNVSENIRKKARKVGGRIARAMEETPEFISLQRNDRALRSEMSEIYEKIGKRVMLLYKKSRGESPFERYKGIRSELLKLEGLEEEYRDNKAKLAEVKRKIRKGR